MKERPILFSGPMVRAILEDHKTMTRRVIRGAGVWVEHDLYEFGECYWPVKITEEGQEPILCPYGQPGDLLWVKETWSPWADKSTEILFALSQERVIYKADYLEGTPPLVIGGDYHWHPSIYMPRWASRLTLRITDVRVERVQEITDGDVAAEGVEWGKTNSFGSRWGSPARDAFAYLWDSLNASYSWESNPWVWVLEFERVSK